MASNSYGSFFVLICPFYPGGTIKGFSVTIPGSHHAESWRVVQKHKKTPKA